MVWARGCRVALVVAGLCSCLAENPSDGTGSVGTETGDTGDGTGDTGPAGGGAILGCPAGESCTLVLVSEALDDRVEVFSPGDPGGKVYRGTIDLDLKPNGENGDNSGELLDEPYGLALAAEHLHVLVGHYPQRMSGSLVAFPTGFFEGYEAGVTIPVEDYFVGGGFSDPVVDVALEQEEPIFMLEYGAWLLVGVFNNDLFAAESEWTNVGRLLVIDPADPTQFGMRELSGPEGVDCAGASEVIDVGGGRVAIACDGNEAVAFVDVSTIQGAMSASTAAANANVLRVCALPAMQGRRVRHLAPDGDGGVLVGAGPGFDPTGEAELYRIDGNDCSLRSIVDFATMGAFVGQVVSLPGFGEPVWLVASGAGQFGDAGMRGVYVVVDPGSGGQLQVCADPLPNLDWSTPLEPVDPFALAVSGDGTSIAIGAGPPSPMAQGVGYGKVFWATLSGDDPCALDVQAEELTAGEIATVEGDPSTYRRGPAVVVIEEVSG